MRLILLIALPSLVGLILFSIPLISSLFAYGEFGLFDVLQTQKSLIAFALGIPAFMLVKVLASGFYAKQNIKTPVKVGVIALIVNSLLCLALIFPLKHAGLALASSIASYVNAGILLRLLCKRGIYQPQPGWLKFGLQLSIANAVMAVYLFYVNTSAVHWLAYSLGWRLTLLLSHVGIAGVIYCSILLLCGVRLNDFRGKVRD